MKIFLGILVVLALIGGVYYVSSIEKTTSTPETSGEVEVSNQEQERPAPQQKINIDVVCDGALAYMTFPDGESAAQFVAECKEGKHPEVIERYKAEMNVGDGAAI